MQRKEGPAFGYEAGLLAHTTIVGGGATGISRTLRTAAVRHCCMPGWHMPARSSPPSLLIIVPWHHSWMGARSGRARFLSPLLQCVRMAEMPATGQAQALTAMAIVTTTTITSPADPETDSLRIVQVASSVKGPRMRSATATSPTSATLVSQPLPKCSCYLFL